MNDLEAVAQRRQRVRLRPQPYGRRGSGRRGRMSSSSWRCSSDISLGCVAVFFVITVMILASRLEAPGPLRTARPVSAEVLKKVSSLTPSKALARPETLVKKYDLRRGIESTEETKLLSNCSEAKTWIAGMDIRGGDMQMKPLLGLNQEECCKACLARPKCIAWTAVESNGNCWIKSEYGRRIVGKGMTSGILRALQVAESTTISTKSQAVMPREARKEHHRGKQSPLQCRHTAKEEGRLYYESAARDWSEAFPLGTGRLGALVGLEPWSGRVALAEETLFERRTDIEKAKAELQAREATARSARAEKNKSTADDKKWAEKPTTPFHAFELARTALNRGDLKAASDAARWLDAGPVPSFEGLGTLNFQLREPSFSEIIKYERSLDLESAVASARFLTNSSTLFHHHRRTAFASAADNVLVLQFECFPIDCQLSISMQRAERAVTSRPTPIHLVLSDRTKIPGLGFAACARFLNASQTRQSNEEFSANGSDIVLLVTGVTSYTTETPIVSCLAKLDDAAGYTYDELKDRHVKDFKAAFASTRLSLQDSNRFLSVDNAKRGQENAQVMDTGLRVAELGEKCFWDNTTSSLIMDPSLLALSYNYARYLLISSSRESSIVPANLQGVWADGLKAPWAGDFHLNINLEMAYWAAGAAGLAAISGPPLFKLLDRLVTSGQEVAQEYYGVSKGWVAHGFTDISANARPLGENRWALCVTCGAWLAITVYELTEFQPSDCSKLLPLMKHIEGSVEFFLDGYLMKMNHTLITGPTTSPENSYRSTLRYNKNKSHYLWSTLARSPAIDVAILFRLFEVYEEGCTRLETCKNPSCNNTLVAKARLARSQLPNRGQPQPCLDASGQGSQELLREYPLDGDEGAGCVADPGHRHFSGLWALMPGRQVSPLDNQNIATAAAATLRTKMNNKGGHTGWSRAWAAALAARLHDGPQTETHLMYLIRTFFTANLLATHPPLKPINSLQRQGCVTCFEADFQTVSRPMNTAKRKAYIREPDGMITSSKDVFQLDANLGLAAAIHEALAQSHRGSLHSVELHLLPALPPSWTHGHILGLKVRGGFQLDLFWAHSTITNVSLHVLDTFAHTISIRTPSFLTSPISMVDAIEYKAMRLRLQPSSIFQASSPQVSYPEYDITRIEGLQLDSILHLTPSSSSSSLVREHR